MSLGSELSGMFGKLSVPARVLEVGPAVIWLDGCELRILDGWLVGCPDGLSLPKSDGDSLGKFEVLGLSDSDRLGEFDGAELEWTEGDSLGECEGPLDELGRSERYKLGEFDGTELGLTVGDSLGGCEGTLEALGREDSNKLGEFDGTELGLKEGKSLGECEGHLEVLGLKDSNELGEFDGAELGLTEGESERIALGRVVGTLDGMSDGDFVGYTVVVSVGGCVAAMHSFKNGTQREWRLDIQTKTPSHCTLVDSTVLPHAVLSLFCILILYRLLTAGPIIRATLFVKKFLWRDVVEPESILIAPP